MCWLCRKWITANTKATCNPGCKPWATKALCNGPKRRQRTSLVETQHFGSRKKFELNKQASFSRSHCVVLDRRGAGKHGAPQVCITNVHLESSQNKQGFDRRARQLNSALSFAAKEAPRASLIACGNFNTGADSRLFSVLRDFLWHGHVLSSVYEHPSTARTLPVNHATFMVPGHYYVIDHMLYSHETLSLSCALSAFSQEEQQELLRKGEDFGFPNAACPSDHIPVGALFKITPAEPKRPPPATTSAPESQRPLSEECKAELIAGWRTLQA
jgi:hypothetical protein